MPERTKIVPTVGRIVLCWDAARRIAGLPGIIVHVWGNTPDATVNVHVFGDGVNEPYSRNMISVRVYEPDEPTPNVPHCTWMPYQVGQAALTEKIAQQAGLIDKAPEAEASAPAGQCVNKTPEAAPEAVGTEASD